MSNNIYLLMQKSVGNRRTIDGGMLLSTSHSADSQTHVTVPLMCLSVGQLLQQQQMSTCLTVTTRTPTCILAAV